jgi:hypothetical protein
MSPLKSAMIAGYNHQTGWMIQLKCETSLVRRWKSPTMSDHTKWIHGLNRYRDYSWKKKRLNYTTERSLVIWLVVSTPWIEPKSDITLNVHSLTVSKYPLHSSLSGLPKLFPNDPSITPSALHSLLLSPVSVLKRQLSPYSRLDIKSHITFEASGSFLPSPS